ncbi:MAG: hypothetical protein BWY67_02171 [Bacteroidetes bacterium ADurb.Bin397]|nr:MAG: hypothetical protein BWY67_02171 [Bacteroidetes bacterium ADurb.Bin397]
MKIDNFKNVYQYENCRDDKIIEGVFLKCFRQRCKERESETIQNIAGNIECHDEHTAGNTNNEKGNDINFP